MTNMATSALPGADQAVLIIGGYGAVGGGIVRTLLRDSHCAVLVAGSNLGRARAFCQDIDARAAAVALAEGDLPVPDALLHRAAVVVNCVENLSPRIAMQCRAAGIHYVDVSATAAVLDAVQAQWAGRGPLRSSAILSVGVAPGITNLLARQARDLLGPLRHVDITVLLGAGEVHGLAAIRWTLDQLGAAFTVKTQAGRQTVRAFGDARTARLPSPHGERVAYRFDFSDQHTLPRTLTLPSAATWLCFDSRPVTWAFAWMARLGITRRVSVDILAKWLVWAGAHVPLGGARFLVQVDAIGQAGDRTSWAVEGDGEAACTAAVASVVARRLLAGTLPSGEHHIKEVLTLDEVLQACPRDLRSAVSGAG